MIEYLDSIDRQLMLWMNFDGGVLLDQFFWWYSWKWLWIPLYAVMLFMLWKKAANWRLFLLQVVCVALIITIADQWASHLIKPLVCRLRPAQDPLLSPMIHIVNGDRGYGYGFVSSHAANTWALMVYMAYIFKKRWVNWSLAAWALVTCYSRIYLGVHYLGDVLGGTVVGVLSAVAVMELLYKRVIRFKGGSDSDYKE